MSNVSLAFNFSRFLSCAFTSTSRHSIDNISIYMTICSRILNVFCVAVNLYGSSMVWLITNNSYGNHSIRIYLTTKNRLATFQAFIHSVDDVGSLGLGCVTSPAVAKVKNAVCPRIVTNGRATNIDRFRLRLRLSLGSS